MPARSKVASLPGDVRDELGRRLVAGGFGGYRELVEWIESRGFRISLSSLHRHGQKLEERIEALRLSTDMAQAMRAAVDDDDGAFSEITLRMIQERIFNIMLEAEDESDIKALSGAARSVADAALAGKRLREERRKAAEELDRMLAAEEETAQGKDPREVLRRIRREVYGIVDG